MSLWRDNSLFPCLHVLFFSCTVSSLFFLGSHFESLPSVQFLYFYFSQLLFVLFSPFFSFSFSLVSDHWWIMNQRPYLFRVLTKNGLALCLLLFSVLLCNWRPAAIVCLSLNVERASSCAFVCVFLLCHHRQVCVSRRRQTQTSKCNKWINVQS